MRLRHVSDEAPGIRRTRAGRGFRYTGAVTEEDRARIRSLAIPPAWTDVWICADPLGHIQATGRDAKGRKQYRYHPVWREARDRVKYSKLLEFGLALPAIRAAVSRDLAKDGLPKERVVAAVVWLLDHTLVRVGNEEYARRNGSHGLTTLRDRHVRVRGPRLTFRFRAKGGKACEVDVEDRRIARVVRRCRDLPGQELFQYENGDGPHSVGSHDVNDYLRDAAGDEFSAKHFRTWTGTVLAMQALTELGPAKTKAEARSAVVDAVKEAAERLANTAAVCRTSYVHPIVVDAYLAGRLPAAAARARRIKGLSRAEGRLVAVLRSLEPAGSGVAA